MILCNLGGSQNVHRLFSIWGTFCYRGTFSNDFVCDLGGHFVTGGCFAPIVCDLWGDVLYREEGWMGVGGGGGWSFCNDSFRFGGDVCVWGEERYNEDHFTTQQTSSIVVHMKF